MSWFCSQQCEKTSVLLNLVEGVKFDDATKFVGVPRGFQTMKRQHWHVWLATTSSVTYQLSDEGRTMLENRPETTLCGGKSLSSVFGTNITLKPTKHRTEGHHSPHFLQFFIILIVFYK